MKLSDYLSEHSLSQAEFAARVGTNQATISRYLNGRRRPRQETLSIISEATGGKVTPNDFFAAATATMVFPTAET